MAYVVMGDGRVAGVGAQLFAVSIDEISFGGEGQVTSRLPLEAIRSRGPIEAAMWPSRA